MIVFRPFLSLDSLRLALIIFVGAVMMVMVVQRPAQATEAATSCVDSPLFDQMAEVDKGLDDAQSVYHQYLQWVTLARSREFWQEQVADHRTALQELHKREEAVISSLSDLYSNGNVVFQTGADGIGYTYTNGKFHKGVQPFFSKDLGGEDDTDWNDLVDDERTKMSVKLATFLANIAYQDINASEEYCSSSNVVNPMSPFLKGYLGIIQNNFCGDNFQQCGGLAVPKASIPSIQSPSTNKNLLNFNDAMPPRRSIEKGGATQNFSSSLNLTGSSSLVFQPKALQNNSGTSVAKDPSAKNGPVASTGGQGCVCSPNKNAYCIENWVRNFGGLVYQWNEQRKKELDLRGQSVQAMRSLDELNALGRSLQQAMMIQSGTGTRKVSNLNDDDLKEKFLSFLPARYGALFNRLSALRQNACAGMAVRPLTDLYQRVTSEARQYDVTLLPTGDDAGSTLIDSGKMAEAIKKATTIALQPEDFAKMRQGNCGPTASCAESDEQTRCQRYVYDIPSTIAWAQQNASAIVGNKAKFRQLTCGDATYPLP